MCSDDVSRRHTPAVRQGLLRAALVGIVLSRGRE